MAEIQFEGEKWNSLGGACKSVYEPFLGKSSSSRSV
jgi:hypothetical protein